MTTGIFSSRTEEWATPQYVFDALDKEFHFTLDVCATHENHKCPEYFTKEQDGLAQPWTGVVWMNPPYGKQIRAWMQKARDESRKIGGPLVVCLIHARTDTRFWHESVMDAAEIRFIPGRLYFGDGKGRAPFPSCIVVFNSNYAHGQSPNISTARFTPPKKG